MDKCSVLLIMLFLSLVSCSKDETGIDEIVDEVIETAEPLSADRIAWNYSSLQRLAPLSGNFYSYTSYPRMIELTNGDFLCVYEADKNIDMIRSTDKGITWSQPMRIATMYDNKAMAVPEIVQLLNGDVIVSYNPRPAEPYTEGRHFGIATRISNDNGATWGSENIIYEADYTHNNGCWEPNIIQLPNGEVQLYFANEADYTYSNEQNISMFRSADNGETWGEREIVCFSATSRDGMPVALYLEETDEIIMAIEDNFQFNFKPAIIKTGNNWQNAPVGRNTSDRYYALSHDVQSQAYQGAPYIRKMPSGNVILSYQGKEDRDGNNSTMYVQVGDKTGKGFSNKTEPFKTPSDKKALWNSLSVMDNKVWAVSSTTAYSDRQEVWTIEGYEITEYKLPQKEITIDGHLDDTNQNFPFFVGHKRVSNVKFDLAQNETKLFVTALVSDYDVEASDGIIINVDPKNISSTKPVSGTYAFTIKSDGSFIAQEGYNGKWESSKIKADDISVNITEEGYIIEFSMSWEKLQGKPVVGARIGFSACLKDNGYTDVLANANKNEPYTWGTIKL